MKTNLVLFIAIGLTSVAALAANPEPCIVPAIQQWQGAEGSLNPGGVPIVLAKEDAAALHATAELFQADLAASGLPKPEILIAETRPVTKAIFLDLNETPMAPTKEVIEEQAHAVDITPNGIALTAHNPGGIFAGTRSIMQMLAASRELPAGRIVDGPVTRMRMLMLDAGRKAFPIDSLYDYLRVLGWYKMNVLHLHLSDSSFDGRYGGFRVQCDTFPGLTSKDCFYSKAELRAFQDRAAAMGIMVLPEIDMPGHAAPFTLLWPELAWRKNPLSSALDVTNPEVIPRMKQVLDEIIPLFDSPYFHIGTDEYRVPYKDDAERLAAGEAFRGFINTMNAHVRSKGKQCVVWDGWEHVKGSTEIDPTVVVDMWWGVFDTNAYIKRGHKVINSCQNWTYLTSGRPAYGVNNAGVYNNQKPNSFGKVNAPMDEPNFLGTKLHVWCGQGPTGWTMTEIAGETFESVRALSETLWGRKGSANYKVFLAERAERVGMPPGVTVLDRITGKDAIVLDHPQEVVLKKGAPAIPLPLHGSARADLEFPWTLTMEIRQDAPNGRGVILSSDLAEVCANYEWNDRKKVVNAAEADRGKEKFEKIIRRGFGINRATGNWNAKFTGPAPTPADTTMGPENSRVYDEGPLPSGQWVKYTVVAEKRRTRVFRDDKLVGESGGNVQSICPLRRLGSIDPQQSFIGSIRNLRVVNKAETPAFK
jgi:hexosaminidase